MTGDVYKISFDDIKRTVPINKVIALLAIQGLRQRGQTQWKGSCPFCKNRDCFVINSDGGKDKTGVFNCFKCMAGGDQIELLSMMRGNPRRDRKGVYAAAEELHAAFIATEKEGRNRISSSCQSEPMKRGRSGFDPDVYARSLDPGHDALKPLVVEPDTLRQWKAGYASAGVHRGRLAMPLTTKNGEVIGYLGRAIHDDPPILTFPNGIVPQDHIFGSDRLVEGQVFLVRDPIEVLKAYETGCGNAICFLTREISPKQLECLAALMDERSCEGLSFF